MFQISKKLKSKKLKELNHKYLSYKNQYTLRLKEVERELDIIRKKIDLIGQETNNEDKIEGGYLKEIDYIANLGLLLNPNETLNILPKQHKVDYNFFIPNRVLQLFTIIFIFIWGGWGGIGVFRFSGFVLRCFLLLTLGGRL